MTRQFTLLKLEDSLKERERQLSELETKRESFRLECLSLQNTIAILSKGDKDYKWECKR